MATATLTYGHGTENDFLLLLDEADQIQVRSEAIKKFCDRVTGIGADGFIRMVKRNGHWFMDYRNSDGSLAEMCGNGIRVMARYLVDRGLQGAGLFPIDTRAGKKFLAVPEDGEISVNLGKVEDLTSESDEISIKQNGRIWPALHIDVGNPHAVTFIAQKISDEKFFDLGPKIGCDKFFPNKTNVEFARILSDDLIEVRVWERGAGETLACGTGACAVGILAIKKNLVKSKKVLTRFKGGDLFVEWKGAGSDVVMSGGYEKEFDGEINLES